ncbi:MSP2 [Arabidopsis thaliana]|uniref:MSP2 n=1 Tax=Arabidopsis thaliana TaxID=3702 RepID=A0A178UD03_ARATH|nr:MSP2 [Arabidopsis thaliana]
MLSRLEHLDFVIKNLERQQNLPKWKDKSAPTTRGLIDRGTAIREAYFKGSLLDRIAALETRLFQICLELESSSGSSTSTGGSGETSSQRIKRDLTKTLPIFSSNINPFHVPLQHPQDLRMEEKIEEEKEEEINVEKPLLEKKNKKTKKNDANETCKPKKKKTKSPKKWSRFSLLGC